MTREEFSNQFDVLVNSYTRFRDFDSKEPRDTIEFDEYEKSLYLTKAQEELVVSLYNGKNPYQESFEQTEELRRYLSDLVNEAELSPITNTSGKPIGMEGKNSYFFTLPDGSDEGVPAVWFITYESVLLAEGKCETHTTQDVYPVRQDEYHKIKRNPFRGANDRRALRLDLSENNIEIVSKYEVSKYYLRYLRKVRPIVLENMPNDLTVNGINEATDCELHESLHQRILELAVRMALQSKGYTINNENK
jgi:hypothetical protein